MKKKFNAKERVQARLALIEKLHEELEDRSVPMRKFMREKSLMFSIDIDRAREEGKEKKVFGKIWKDYCAYVETRDRLEEMSKGACGKIEEEVCQKDPGSYCSVNCKICQNGYVAALDAALNRQEEKDLLKNVRTLEMDDLEEDMREFIKKQITYVFLSYDYQRKNLREIVPSLLRNIH